MIGFGILTASLICSVAMYKPEYFSNHLRHWLFW